MILNLPVLINETNFKVDNGKIFSVKFLISQNNSDNQHYIEELSDQILSDLRKVKLNFTTNKKIDLLIAGQKQKINSKQWVASRLCLSKLLNFFSKNYKKNKYLAVSISHTKNFSIAAGICSDTNIDVGVDIEEIDRMISNKVISRIKNSNDIHLSSNLDLWNIKEAVFKSIQLENQTSLNEINIIEKIHTNQFKCIFEKEAYSVNLVRTENLNCAFSLRI